MIKNLDHLTNLHTIISILLISLIPFVFTQISTSELEDEVAQEIANRSYAEEQTELQRSVLSKYNKRVRPVKNISEALDVAVHVYIMHISVNQNEQTVTINGHIYMTWKDEFAVWEPSEHNGVRITMLKQWEVWTPELRTTNSVSGVGQFFEISKRSHVIIQSQGRTQSQVEMYPTFSIKVGCAFDYSAYPFDMQKCAMGLYTNNRMSEVQLSVFYQMQPTVLLGWGAQSDKTHISDWRLDSVTTNVTYFSDGQYSDEKPTNAESLETSWSILNTWLVLERSAPYFFPAILLPAIVSYMMTTFSFLLISPDSSIFTLLANFFFLGIFLQDLLPIIPPAVGRLPKIVWFTASNFILTSFAMFIQLWLRYLLKRKDSLNTWSLYILQIQRIIPERWKKDDAHLLGYINAEQNAGKQLTWTTVVNCIRIICIVIYLLLFLILLIIISV